MRFLICCLLPLASAFAAAEKFTDSTTDEELRAYRNAKVAELRKRADAFAPEETDSGKAYPGIFFCTVYYTPKESGFTAERGFDDTPRTARGLKGHRYPASFLSAVKMEGFGRIVTPVDGQNYIRYAGGGRYAFADAPLGRKGNVLVPKKSCAISSRNPYLQQDTMIEIDSETVREVMGDGEWLIEDTGGGVHPLQIDLYWGEDEPRGAKGRNRHRPAGTWMEYSFETTVIVGKAEAAEGAGSAEPD